MHSIVNYAIYTQFVEIYINIDILKIDQSLLVLREKKNDETLQVVENEMAEGSEIEEYLLYEVEDEGRKKNSRK